MGQGDEIPCERSSARVARQWGYNSCDGDPMKRRLFYWVDDLCPLCCLPAAFIVDRKGAIVWMGSTARSRRLI